MGAPVCNHVRFFPAPLREANMVGGKISGSNVSATEGFHVLAEIKEKPREQEWTDLVFSNNKLYRWLRYDAPPGSHGCVAELQFYSGERKLDGYRFGSIGELKGRGWRFAFDGDTKTWVEMEEADGQYAGLDLFDQATARTPKFLPPPGGVEKPLEVALNELTPYAKVRYTLDGSMPTATTGEVYEKPIKIEKTTTVIAAAFVEGWAASPPLIGTYLIRGDVQPGLTTLHIGNTLTDITAQFPQYLRTSGREHLYRAFTIPGAWTNQLWGEHLQERKREWGIALGGAAAHRSPDLAAARFQHPGRGRGRPAVHRPGADQDARGAAVALCGMGRARAPAAQRQGRGAEHANDEGLSRAHVGGIHGRDAALRRGFAAQDRGDGQGREARARAAHEPRHGMDSQQDRAR